MRYGDTAGNDGPVEEKTYGDEANISAPQPAAGAEAWIQAPDDDAMGPGDFERATCPWTKAADEGLATAQGYEGLAKGARLRRGREIQRVFDEGASLRGSRFLLRWVGNDLGTIRWAFAVGKKLAPTATERNSVRRRMRAAAVATEAAPDGLDVVLVAGRGALTATVAEMATEIRKLITRARAEV